MMRTQDVTVFILDNVDIVVRCCRYSMGAGLGRRQLESGIKRARFLGKYLGGSVYCHTGIQGEPAAICGSVSETEVLNSCPMAEILELRTLATI